MSDLPPKDTNPWPNLQDDAADLILTRLPLSDHARFASVCRRWRSIQTRRILRHAPLPPPSLPLPYIFPSSITHNQPSILCYSPFEQSTYRFPLPSPLFPAANNLTRSSSVLSSSPSGYLLLLLSAVYTHSCWFLTLINPLPPTRLTHLPAIFPDPPFNVPTVASLSSTAAIVAHRCVIFLIRLSDPNPQWIKLSISSPPPPSHLFIHKAVACRGRFYCKCYKAGQMVVIDPSLAAVQMLDMGAGQLPPPRPFVRHQQPAPDFLAECGGRVMLVTYVDRMLAVFEADLGGNRWSRVAASLGGGGGFAVFLGNVGCVSMAAGDGGRWGAECVYFPRCLLDDECDSAEWKGFDLREGRMVDGPWLPADSGDAAIVHLQKYGLVFLPALCC